MLRQLWLIVMLALMTLCVPGTLTLDGATKGRAFGAVALHLGNRRVALVVVQHRPNRFYYRAIAA